MEFLMPFSMHQELLRAIILQSEDHFTKRGMVMLTFSKDILYCIHEAPSMEVAPTPSNEYLDFNFFRFRIYNSAIGGYEDAPNPFEYEDPNIGTFRYVNTDQILQE